MYNFHTQKVELKFIEFDIKKITQLSMHAYNYSQIVCPVHLFIWLAISNCKKTHSCIITMCSWHGEVDPAIRRHGKPHVVRVGVVSTLVPAVHQKVFLISRGSYLSKEFKVMVWPSVAVSTEHSSMDEHLPGSGGDHTGDGEGDG